MRVLLTGATGFVGSYLYPALVAAGCQVRCATRDAAAARESQPDRDWVELDVERPESLGPALRGCGAAFYLIHGMKGHGADYPQREARSAENFLRSAESSGVERIVYLGGVLPVGKQISRHLASRRDTGKRLRSGSVTTIELRAAMIVGAGSTSWTIVRDLAERLPAMLLPSWLSNHSFPVAIDDVVWTLIAALFVPASASRIFDMPGPERIAHRDLLLRVAQLRGHTRPMISVPVLTPKLSSYWIALVTRVNLELAKELVEGLRYDLDPQENIFWDSVPHQPMTLEDAARLAFADERAASVRSFSATARLQELGRRFRGTS